MNFVQSWRNRTKAQRSGQADLQQLAGAYRCQGIGHADGQGDAVVGIQRVALADYRRGLLRVQPQNGQVDVLLGHRNSEGFKGLNDLTFDSDGHCYFTDQGQTGMHDPTGRVYRWRTDGRLDLLINNAPSPNGIALDREGRFLYVAVTRGNAVWRGPLLPDGTISKVGVFRSFFGASGPDGLAVDADNRLVVAHASLGGAFVMNVRGEVTHFVRSPTGQTITNAAFRPGSNELVMTDSEQGVVLSAHLPSRGLDLFSHQL